MLASSKNVRSTSGLERLVDFGNDESLPLQQLLAIQNAGGHVLLIILRFFAYYRYVSGELL